MATKPTQSRSKAERKSTPKPTKSAAPASKPAQRKAKKPQPSNLAIAQQLSNDPAPLSFKRYPGDFFVIIHSDGKKHTYHPEAVRNAIKALS